MGMWSTNHATCACRGVVVIELGIHVNRDPSLRSASVHFPTLYRRERGKLANFLVGGMDLAANGMSIEALLQRERFHLSRILLSGPIRAARKQFMARSLSLMHRFLLRGAPASKPQPYTGNRRWTGW